MVTNKANIIAQEIDVARCKGNWQAIPELARRYKKHNPNGIVLEQSILAEASLIQLIQTNRPETKQHCYKNDSPSNVTIAPRVDPIVFQSVQKQLSIALGDKDSSSETQLHKQMSKVVLARSYFESGEYQKAIHTLSDTKLESTTGYAGILMMQALSMQAMSYDLLHDDSHAIKSYQTIVTFINTNTVERVEWAEDALYRATLLALRERVGVRQTMDFIRAYQKICSSQLNNWRIHKRLVVTRCSLDYVSSVYKAGEYQPPVDYKLTEEGKQMDEAEYLGACRAYNHQLFSIEIMQLHTVFEKLIYTLISFPRSGQTNQIVLDFVDRLALDMQLVGGSEMEKRGYVEALNRASTKTFNSPRVTRYLFHALVSLGDYEEAEHALKTYLHLVGLESKTSMENREMTAALASDTFGFNTPVPDEQVEALAIATHQDGPQRSLEIESAEHTIGVLAIAVKLYCQELSKGADAVILAELAFGVYQRESHINPEFKKVFGAQVHRMLGIAFGFLACQTFDQDRRPQYHDKALKSLHTSLEIDDQSWQTYYQLALQLAEMRDIYSAISMISKSLQLKSRHLPSWHLLALLCTCPINDNLNQALETCQLALSQASVMIKESWFDYSDEIAQQVLLQMTQTLLAERLHGAEEAFTAQQDLFQLFGKIVVPELIPDSTSTNMLHETISNGNARYGMVLSGSLGNIEPTPPPSATNSTEYISRHRSSSNASSFANGRPKSISSFTGRKLHLAEMFHHDVAVKKKFSLKQKGTKKEVKPIESDGTTGSLTSLLSTTSVLSTHHTLLSSTTVLTRPTAHARLQHQRSCRMLCDLWLLSADIYLNMGKLDEALKAVQEAENVDWTTHAGVWCLLGRIRLAQAKPLEAIAAFQKGLVTKPNDVACRIWLAKSYMTDHIEIAEGILEAVTKENGWNHPVAWFYLGELYKQTGRLDRTKDCLFYALELESTTPIQPFEVLPRFV